MWCVNDTNLFPSILDRSSNFWWPSTDHANFHSAAGHWKRIKGDWNHNWLARFNKNKFSVIKRKTKTNHFNPIVMIVWTYAAFPNNVSNNYDIIKSRISLKRKMFKTSSQSQVLKRYLMNILRTLIALARMRLGK